MVDAQDQKTTPTQENPEKSNSEQLCSILAQLSTDQIRFVVARQEHATDKLAAKAIGVKPDTVYHWPKIVREAVQLLAFDGLVLARHLRSRNLAKAMLVKISGLDSGKEQIKQNVATEIIDWEMGKATQRQEVTGKDGGPLAVCIDDVLNALPAELRELVMISLRNRLK